ncbi:MAG TPA: response regulator transcription factor [Angustibacter sp.]|nr:response regulator transcription factor [Angustibacter sp.]
MPTRLLVLEDDDGIRNSLALSLEDEGYDVVQHADAESALATVEREPVDLMLVDLMLGGMDGFTFIRRARPSTDAPIIVLSARNDTHDIVSALEAGADDYVTKPYVVREVLARLKALLRRPAVAAGTTDAPPADGTVVLDASDGPLLLSPDAGTVRRGAETIHLTVTEFRLLCELADPPGRVLSRTTLLERVWDRGFFGDERIVDVHIRRLRTKIERDPGQPQLVVTVRGLGYRLDVR